MKRLLAILPVFVVLALIVPAGASASGKHWCRIGDPPVRASAQTSCAFAVGIADRVYQLGSPPERGTLRVQSPTTHRSYRIQYYFNFDTGYVTAWGQNGIWVRFFGPS